MAANLATPKGQEDCIKPAVASYLNDSDLGRLVECIADGVIVHQDEFVVYANSAALAQFGVNTVAELAGYKMLDLVASKDRLRTQAFNRRLLADRNAVGRQIFSRLQVDGTQISVETVTARIKWKGRPALLDVARGISEYEQTRMALRESEARLEGFLATAADWYWETDAEHRFTYFSKNLSESGYRRAEVFGNTRWELAGALPDQCSEWSKHLADLTARRPFRNFEYRSHSPKGIELHRSISGDPIFDAEGAFQGYRGTSRDITERKRAERMIKHVALHDTLTKLPNRAYFQDGLKRACRAAERDGSKVVLLFLDLDYFKDINDSMGHSAGDQLLIEVAARLKACVRSNDLVARLGGDEFVVVVERQCDPASISDLADRLTKSIEVPFEIDERTVRAGISVGVTTFPDDGTDPEKLLSNADFALYTAKRAGRRTWRVFDHRLQKQLQARRSLDQALRQALDQSQFELHFQPLIGIASNSVRGFEALIRWNHPARGQILPDMFVPATEQNRLIIPLTEWILLEATTQLQHWISTGLGKFKIAVNVPPMMLKMKGFADLIDQCLVTTGGDARNLVVEITEGALIDEDKAIPAITALRDRGVTVAVDDFGMGYSSMARLKTLPVDTLKIDRSFLRNIADDSCDTMVVESLVKVGQGLGKKVVAEGVENPEQLSFLEHIGCDFAQGFFISRPMTAADVPIWLHQWRSSSSSCQHIA